MFLDMARLKTLPARLQQLAPPLRTATVKEVRRLAGRPWERIRQRILRRDCGLCHCDECVRNNRTLPAHEVDHIVELDDGGTDDDSNLRAINRDCHVLKTAQARAARRG